MPVVIKLKFTQITAAIRKAADESIEDSANLLRLRIDDLMRLPKHGRIYTAKIGLISGGSTHQASAPGEAPAIELGDYGNSIKAEKLGPMQARVATDMERGVWLEFGTARVAARPHFVPAAESIRSDFARNMFEAVFDAAAKEDIKD